MNSKTIVLATLVFGLLAACNGSREDGIHTTISAKALSTKAVPADTEEISFRRADGMRIDLQLGLLNVAPLELLSCDSGVASLAKTLLGKLNPISVASAHSGSEEVPAGLVDVMDGSAATFDLGELNIKPGTYCGVVVELRPGAGAISKHGGALDTSMVGASINVAPCYYAGTAGVSDTDAEAATSHHCIQAKYKGEERQVTIKFAQPLTLDSRNRSVDLTLLVRYEEWFDGIDMDTLASSADEQSKLADNVAAAVHAVVGEQQNVTINFKTQIGGEDAVCSHTYQGLGNGAQKDATLNDFRFYVSGVQLKNASVSVPVSLAKRVDGSVYQDDAYGVALLGFAQGCDGAAKVNHLSLSGVAPQGEFDQICFTLGIPEALNHLDAATAPSPMNVTAVDWAWLFGRIFFKVDTLADPDGAAAPFFVHLGSTGCTNGSPDDFFAPPTVACSQANRPQICLNYAPVKSGHAIVADIAPVVADSDLTYNTADTAPGCMSFPDDPECINIIPKFGLPYLYNGSYVARQDQLLFKVASE